MKRTISQIRDLDQIEKELNSNTTGVLAFSIDEDKIVQVATTYLYLDKNVYIFFREEDELFENIRFQSEVSFTVLKTENSSAHRYNIFSITISGLIKKLDDQKTIDDLAQNYLKKYSDGKGESEKTPTSLSRVVLIDSREIQAIEETGG